MTSYARTLDPATDRSRSGTLFSSYAADDARARETIIVRFLPYAGSWLADTRDEAR